VPEAAEAALPEVASKTPATTPAEAMAPMDPNMVRVRAIMLLFSPATLGVTRDREGPVADADWLLTERVSQVCVD
jgi:hypothetical protein